MLRNFFSSAILSEKNIMIRDSIKRKDVRKFSFVNPTLVFPKRKNVGGKARSPIEVRAKQVEDRLLMASKGSSYLWSTIPNHWVLVVIEVSSKTVFYLDLMNAEPDSDLVDLINSSMKIFAAQHDSRQKWVYTSMVTKVKVLEQPGGSECGYYVMRYIRDIMDDTTVLHTNFHGKQEYSQSEIDVR